MNQPSPKTHRKRKATRAMWIVGILLPLLALLMAPPMILPQRHAADRTQALNNMRSVGLAMLEFDQEFGSLPDDSTAQVVIDATGTELDITGPYSNDCFRQLVAYGIQSEDIFFTVHPEGSRKPDRVLTGRNALAPSEVGMSYVHGSNTSHDPKKPLLLSPLKLDTHLAWRKPFGKRAAVLLIDNSAKALDVNRRGEILLDDGTLLLDSSQPYWRGQPIDIRHPEMP
ncbi:MAG: hypothetical protein AAGB14_12040 [Verrucomicrobiota bacterium]